jgi:diguanylate cyclase (GGDEF)-like protein/PAS domain S-box-containing protein
MPPAGSAVADVLLLVAFTGGVVYLAMHLLSRRRERQLAEAREGEARFRSLTELSADWFWETDAAHRITWLSGGGPVMTLFGTAPAFGKRFWEVAHIEVDPQALRVHLERLERAQPFFDLEVARTDERGARQVHIISGVCQKDANGRVAGYRGVGRDVTGERRVERDLAQAKERVERALEGGNLAEWDFDLESDRIYLGRGWAGFLGQERSPGVHRGQDLIELVHPEDRPAVKGAFIEALKGAGRHGADYRVRTDSGEWKWLHSAGQVTHRDAAGRALRMAGVVADIDERKRGEAALRDAERRYRSVVDFAASGVVVQHAGVIEYANPAAARILKAASPADLVGRKLDSLFHPEDLASVRERRETLLLKGPGQTDFRERRLRCLDGSEVVVEAAGVSYYDGARLMIQGMFRDITESRAARVLLAEREQRFRDVAEAAGEYVWETDREWRFTYLSERVEAVLGYAREELLGRAPRDFMPLGEHGTVEDWFRRHVSRDRPFRDLVHRSITQSGGVIWQSVSGVPMHDGQGRWIGYRGTAADVTARKQAEARIEVLTTRDALTGLANGALVAERAAQAIAEAAHSRSRLALLAIDLDRFRLVNETLGHPAGDALLRAVAERLQNALRREDTLARLGGDDFVLLWNGLRSPEEAAALGSRLQAVLGRPFMLDTRGVHVGASIGIALYPEDGRDYTELLKHADAALYHAKEAGRGTARFYSPALGVAAGARLRLEHELRGALSRGELLLHWQPVVSSRAGHLRPRVVGAEALVRWRHPERGLLMPEEFLPLAEASGLMRAIGDWTLEHALAQAGAWQRSLPGEPWFAVNVAAEDLAEGEAFVRKVADGLQAHGLDGARLELEITERALLSHAAENVATLKRVGELGVRFAIDDFGTGYSSLALLRGLPVDKLKIDRMFLRHLATDPADQAIVGAIAAMARALRLEVVAEGVEDAAQLERLLALGCTDWQGHHFSTPLDAAAFERLFAPEERASGGD